MQGFEFRRARPTAWLRQSGVAKSIEKTKSDLVEMPIPDSSFRWNDDRVF